VNFDIAYKIMLPALLFFHEQTHSYGWAIILLTLAVRAVVWPLVAQSTRSMQRMSKLQPQMKVLQERYKGEPDVLQKKLMEFYQKNKINPMSGCLPTLIQLPILFALFATFSGPPFGDHWVDSKITVVTKVDGSPEKKETSGGNSAYIGKDGQAAKVVMYPGDTTVAVGDTLHFGTRAIEGNLSKDFAPSWKVVGPNSKDFKAAESNKDDATIDDQGDAKFLKAGEYHVGVKVPGVAKNESFGFITGLGKVSNGVQLLYPGNWDTLALILVFGATMYLSQQFTMTTPKPAAGDKLDEQQIIQQQTAKTMPFVATAMFLVIPLQTGVYLYLVISNVVQTLQTWLLMKMPEPAFVDVSGGAPESSPAPGKNGKQGPTATSQDPPGSPQSTNGTGGGGARPSAKKKQKRKKPN
jgi:YidC/Oxa1 family membrane protein insertase